MGLFSGGWSRKLLLCKGVKNKNIGGGGVLSTKPDQQKGPNAKMRKTLSSFQKIFLARFAHSAFYKIYISGAANRHAPVQYAKYVFFSFILSSHRDTNPLLHLYHVRKKILANINSEYQGSYFTFSLSSSSGSNIFVPQQIL